MKAAIQFLVAILNYNSVLLDIKISVDKKTG
jgi:hypothetical protein